MRAFAAHWLNVVNIFCRNEDFFNFRNDVTMNDPVLLEQLRDSKPAAFEEIYNRYWETLFALAFKKVHDSAIAQELVQNVFESLWKNRAVVAIASLESYLRSALKNQVFKYYRSETVKEKYYKHLMTAGRDIYIESNGKELSHTLDRALQQLPDKTREVFQLSRELELSNKAISTHLDISEKAVEYHITRSLKTLRTQLKHFFTF